MLEYKLGTNHRLTEMVSAMKWWFTREIWRVEIKKTPLLNTSSDIQSLCITKNPFFLFSNLKIGLPCGVYMLYETKFYKKKESYGSLTATTVIHISNFLFTNN